MTPTSRLASVRQWFRDPVNLLFLLLLVLIAFPLLYELGRNPVQFWDESRLAVNALGMIEDNNWLVTHFGSAPDHWNTKPPLLIWLQVLSFRALGFSTWALRVPTALASVSTALVLFWFGRRALGQPLAGFLGALVLVTCAGFVRLHVARTADYDALLVMWETIGWTCFFQYLETGRHRYLYWFVGALTAAVLTKSIAGLLGAPALVAYALLRGRLLWLLRQPRLYLAVALGASLIVGYYLAREAADPGYWAAVKYNDLGGRFTEQQGEDNPNWLYYMSNMNQVTFTTWVWAIVPAGLLALVRATGVLRRAAQLAALFTLGWLAVVSASTSQHDWYAAPLFPALALLIGIGLAVLYRDLMSIYLPQLSRRLGWVLQAAVVLGVLFVPYRTIIDQLVHERHSNFGNGPDGYIGRYLTDVLQEQPQVTNLTVLYEGAYNASLDYYKSVYSRQGRIITTGSGNMARTLQPGTIVLVCNPVYKAKLDSAFTLLTIHQDDQCQTMFIQARK